MESQTAMPRHGTLRLFVLFFNQLVKCHLHTFDQPQSIFRRVENFHRQMAENTVQLTQEVDPRLAINNTETIDQFHERGRVDPSLVLEREDFADDRLRRFACFWGLHKVTP